jgi:hypothetical protein
MKTNAMKEVVTYTINTIYVALFLRLHWFAAQRFNGVIEWEELM